MKRTDKERVAIKIGGGQIIELEKNKINIIHNVNLFLSLLQIASSLFIFYLVGIVWNDLISIEEIVLTSSSIIQEAAAEYLFMAILIFFGVCLLLSGLFSAYLVRESKELGI